MASGCRSLLLLLLFFATVATTASVKPPLGDGWQPMNIKSPQIARAAKDLIDQILPFYYQQNNKEFPLRIISYTESVESWIVSVSSTAIKHSIKFHGIETTLGITAQGVPSIIEDAKAIFVNFNVQYSFSNFKVPQELQAYILIN
ncbi:hypothetical protein AXF42_Ash017659 [Apostasia shenzhenica]|uniref:Uncharacterized protein n=1 Tax=Apostasia shenzhenica TaxID=1088818 RepID=A0A2I0A5G9_9ASPA|nr:hypothetical protein AXF42_Ash017659 [Apostasia shenzhenica]